MSAAVSTNFPEWVVPGSTLTVDTPVTAGNQYLFSIHPNGAATPADPQVAATVNGTKLSVTLPAKMSPGRYFLTFTEKNPAGAAVQTDTVVPGEIRIGVDQVKVDSVHPTTAYRNPTSKRFDFDVIGDGFWTPTPSVNQVVISGRGPVIRSWGSKASDCAAQPVDNLPCLWLDSPQVLHVVGYQPDPYQGPLTLSAQVGSVRSQSAPLVLARRTETEIILASILSFLILAFLIYRLLASGIRQSVIAGKVYSPFQVFFLDRESNSYSLSKFQFLLFSVTFVFGYLYVFLCRWLVQWQFVLPDVPGSFSGILGISAGTAVASAGATSARGSKGGGPVYPSMADFISMGGQVVPERFQFFVWSLVACGGFLALLLSQNPATLTGFPSFPDGLLYVMGVSAAGYLGGKITRRPGPVIRNILLDTSDGQVLIVQGENLSRDADFVIDGRKLPIIPDASQGMVSSKDQTDAADKSFCTELRIRIDLDRGGDFRTGDHMLKIVNPDSQYNEAHFTGDMPTILTVSSGAAEPAGANLKQIPASDGPIPVQVRGEGFRQGMTACWNSKDLGSSAVQLDPNDPTHNATITLTPGKAGTGVLLLTMPTGFSASATVIVT